MRAGRREMCNVMNGVGEGEGGSKCYGVMYGDGIVEGGW